VRRLKLKGLKAGKIIARQASGNERRYG